MLHTDPTTLVDYVPQKLLEDTIPQEDNFPKLHAELKTPPVNLQASCRPQSHKWQQGLYLVCFVVQCPHW